MIEDIRNISCCEMKRVRQYVKFTVFPENNRPEGIIPRGVLISRNFNCESPQSLYSINILDPGIAKLDLLYRGIVIPFVVTGRGQYYNISYYAASYKKDRTRLPTTITLDSYNETYKQYTHMKPLVSLLRIVSTPVWESCTGLTCRVGRINIPKESTTWGQNMSAYRYPGEYTNSNGFYELEQYRETCYQDPFELQVDMNLTGGIRIWSVPTNNEYYTYTSVENIESLRLRNTVDYMEFFISNLNEYEVNRPININSRTFWSCINSVECGSVTGVPNSQKYSAISVMGCGKGEISTSVLKNFIDIDDFRFIPIVQLSEKEIELDNKLNGI